MELVRRGYCREYTAPYIQGLAIRLLRTRQPTARRLVLQLHQRLPDRHGNFRPLFPGHRARFRSALRRKVIILRLTYTTSTL